MTSEEKRKTIVIGAGIAGIAGAIRMACKGFAVEVFEANSYPGGKLTAFTQEGFRFDAGPSLFTLPHLVEELFELAGKNTSDYFTYRKHPVSCHYFFEDNVMLRFFTERGKLLREVEEKLQIDPVPLHNHLEKSALIYQSTKKSFLEQSLHRFSGYISVETLRCVAAIPKLGLFTTMHKANTKALNHPKLVQIFDRYATYNGSNPFAAPGILNLIAHLEHGVGVFFPEKGMHDITNALVKLALDIGVRFHFSQPVKEIVTSNKAVCGIRTNNGFYPAGIVLCNSDVRPAYEHLLPSAVIPPKTAKQEPSSSAMIFYWGVSQAFPELDLHNIFFSENYEQEFLKIFGEKTVCNDPTVYVHISSKIVSSDAPEGSENWFVMINVPSDSGQDWEALRRRIRSSVLEKLSRILNADIESLIITEEYLDPIRIKQRTGSFAGALYGPSSNDRMAAFFRHPNFSRIRGLYFAGGSVHPGGGIPLCLLSAKIATDLIH